MSSEAAFEPGLPPKTRSLEARYLADERRRRGRVLLLVAPLLVFLLAAFFWPLSKVLTYSVTDNELRTALPRTASLLKAWDGNGLPDATLVTEFGRELPIASERGVLSGVANRLNYDISGFRSLLLKTGRALGGKESVTLQGLVEIDARWGDARFWTAMRHAAGPYTSFYVLAALDRRVSADGEIVQTDPSQRIFVRIFSRTLWVSFVVTIACLALGYPLAYYIAHASARTTNWLLALVLLPFWTSVLVRTTAWAVLLQREGAINDLLRSLGVITEPLQLIYNRAGVYIAMTHVLLPFMILPLFGVMKGIHESGIRAALSLGATPAVAFRRVYLPQSIPGVSAGCLLVFILALGFYVTPALMGGADDQLVSFFIAFYTNETLNWGMAAALSSILLIATLLLFGAYHRIGGASRTRWA